MGSLQSWHQRVHTALFKINDQQGLTVKHRELCSTSCGSWMREQFYKKLCMYMDGKSLCSSSVSAATMSIGYSPIKIKIGSNTQQLGITYEHTGWAPFTHVGKPGTLKRTGKREASSASTGNVS